MSENNFLKRYTQLFSAIEFLETGELQLHSPEKWEDTNDSHALQTFASKAGASRIYVLCLTGASETFHHWKVFCPESRGGGGGVCIEFDKEQLIKAAEHASLTHNEVDYLRIEDLADGSVQKKEAPFLKRLPYGDEKEYRLFRTSSSLSKDKTLSFEVPREAIQRITLSPWMSSETAQKCRQYIKQIDGCKNIAIVHSTLMDNKDWKEAIA